MADAPAGVRAGKAGGPHGLRVLSPADPGYVEWCRSGMPQRIRLLKLAAEKRRRIEQGVICPKCHRRRSVPATRCAPSAVTWRICPAAGNAGGGRAVPWTGCAPDA